MKSPDIDLFLLKRKYLERYPNKQWMIIIPIPPHPHLHPQTKTRKKYYQFNLQAHTKRQWRKDTETGKWVHADSSKERIIIPYFGKYEDEVNRPFSITQEVHHEMDWAFYQDETHIHEEYSETFLEPGNIYETECIYAKYKGDNNRWDMKRVYVDERYQP